jgi:hypothetical protein
MEVRADWKVVVFLDKKIKYFQFHKYWGSFLGSDDDEEPLMNNSAFDMLTEESTQNPPQNAQKVIKVF